MLPIKSTAPVRYPPVATWSLIAINCVVFLFETSLSDAQLEEFLSQFALVPSHFADPAGVADYLPLVSNMFLHGGWLHLILNMWTLWLFGPPVEDQFGWRLYLVFYLFCGVHCLGDACRVQPDVRHPCARRLRGDCRHAGLLHAAVPPGTRHRDDPCHLHSALLRAAGGCIRRPLVPDAGAAGNDRAIPAISGWLDRLVGTYRRLRRRIRPWPSADAVVAAPRPRFA